MAAPDKFSITVAGKGGHGAMPHLSVDAMLCAMQIGVALQTVVAWEIDPLDAAVVSVCKMENEEDSSTCGCGSTFNVLCGHVVMHGTTRSFNNAVQSQIRTSVGECVWLSVGVGVVECGEVDVGMGVGVITCAL